MTEYFDEKRASLALFNYSCKHITGGKNVVKLKRMLNSVFDRVQSQKEASITSITSGSIGEGLELKGSDIDMMEVNHDFNVCINPHDVECYDIHKVNLCPEMENAKPGFSYIRCIGIIIPVDICTRIDCEYYLSSESIKNEIIRLFKAHRINPGYDETHGPCITNQEGSFDMASSLHSRKWIHSAFDWIKRANTAWPDFDIKRTIVEHGVLFVPIGNTGPKYADIMWRISFSVAEKILITSFSHTQLVCYALCKILLKDVMNNMENCGGLLCSYHLKTIIFWISEEQTVEFWRPENLTTCFCKCLQRLVCCVQIGSCPHYFLPEVNLFHKLGEQERICLIRNLNILLSQGWRCLLKSEHLSSFNCLSTTIKNEETCNVNYFSHLICSRTFIYRRNKELKGMWYTTMRIIRELRRCRMNRIKHLYIYSLAQTYKYGSNIIDFIKIEENKAHYIKEKMFISFTLQGLSADAVNGWLSLASFFQKIKRFHQALHILSYILTKFTADKIYKTTEEPTEIRDLHTEWMLSKTMQRKGIMHAIKSKCIEPLIFYERLFLLPEELAELSIGRGIGFPPLAFTHFLRILCQTKLNNYTEAYNAFKHLKLTTQKKFFIRGEYDEMMSLYLLSGSPALLGYEMGRPRRRNVVP